MARLDLHLMPDSRHTGYVLDVQADLLSHLRTRTVVPLLPLQDAPKPIRDLNPTFDIDGTVHVMITQAIASIPIRELKQPVGSLAQDHDRVTRALDILLIGF